MRPSLQHFLPLVSLTLGGLLLKVSALEDGSRGRALLALALVWCILLLGFRTKLHTIDLRWVLGAGLLLRCFGFVSEPFTSHDGLRYLADGAAILHGLNPLDVAYVEHPATFKENWPVFYEHQNYTSIYPPIALALFTGAASTGSLYAWWTWKALCLLTSALILVVLTRMSRSDIELRVITFWVALHPMVIVETTLAPHIDLFVLIPLLFWLKYRTGGPTVLLGAVLGFAALIKPTILLGGLAFLRKLSQRSLQAGAVIGLILGTSFLTLRIMGVASPLGADFGTFLKGWHFGSLLDSVAFWSTQPLPATTRIPFLLCLSALLISLKREKSSFFRDYGDLLFLSLACSPVVFPWYLLILTIWIAEREVPIVAWWSMSLLTYEVLDSFDLDTTWSPSSWPNQFTVIILMLWALSRRTKSFMLVRPQ